MKQRIKRGYAGAYGLMTSWTPATVTPLSSLVALANVSTTSQRLNIWIEDAIDSIGVIDVKAADKLVKELKKESGVLSDEDIQRKLNDAKYVRRTTRVCLSWRWRNASAIIQKTYQTVAELEKTTKHKLDIF